MPLCYFYNAWLLRCQQMNFDEDLWFSKSVLKLFKPYLVYDPKPKVVYMGHIRPTRETLHAAATGSINRHSHKRRPIAVHSLVCPWQSGDTLMCRAGQGCIEYTAVLYLSKFSSGLLLLHSPMCYEVVKHLPCEDK